MYVPSLVKIHWRMLILECSQGCYTVKIHIQLKLQSLSSVVAIWFEVWQIIITAFTFFSFWLSVAIYVCAIFSFPTVLYSYIYIGSVYVHFNEVWIAIFAYMNIFDMRTMILCHRNEKKINQVCFVESSFGQKVWTTFPIAQYRIAWFCLLFIYARLRIKLFVFVFRKQTTMAPFW
jgi:hypothetical protein